MYSRALFGLILNSKFYVSSCKNILIVNHGGLGDFIHSVPLILYLMENGYNVHVSTKKENKLNIFDIDYTEKPYTYYDVIFNINSPKSKWFGLFFANTFDFFGEKVYRKYIKKDWEEIHWADFYINTAKKILNLSSEFKMRYLPTKNEVILIHPGGSFEEKSWGIDNFVWIANELSKNHKVWIVLGPNDYHLSQKFLKNKNLEIVLSLDTIDLLNILKYGKIFIGNDSGVMHAAALFDMPVFCIYTIGCAITHYPYTKNGIFYFDKEQFESFYKKKEILPSKFSKESCLNQIENILNNKFEKVNEKIYFSRFRKDL